MPAWLIDIEGLVGLLRLRTAVVGFWIMIRKFLCYSMIGEWKFPLTYGHKLLSSNVSIEVYVFYLTRLRGFPPCPYIDHAFVVRPC